MAMVPHGTTFTFNEEVVAELTDVDGPGMSGEEVEVTSHDSNWWKEFLPGLIDGGEISLSGNYVPSDDGQAAILAGLKGQTVAAWAITYPNSYGWSGEGFVTAFEPTGPHGDKSEITMTIRTTGEISEVTPGS